MTTSIAFFDFDGTLTKRDTLLPFLYRLVGSSQFLYNMSVLTPVLVGYALNRVSNDIAKQAVLQRFLSGKSYDQLLDDGERYARERLPSMLREAVLERLRWHQDNGHVCVVVSASLDIYIEPWAREQGFDAWLTSRLVVDGSGRVTGGLLGSNCYGEEKVRRVIQWLGDAKPDVTFGYGDSKGDMPMLEMVDNGYYVYRGKLQEYSPVKVK